MNGYYIGQVVYPNTQGLGDVSPNTSQPFVVTYEDDDIETMSKSHVLKFHHDYQQYIANLHHADDASHVAQQLRGQQNNISGCPGQQRAHLAATNSASQLATSLQRPSPPSLDLSLFAADMTGQSLFRGIITPDSGTVRIWIQAGALECLARKERDGQFFEL